MVRVRASRKDYYREWRKDNRERINTYKRNNKIEPVVIAVDGEGLTRNGEHTYNYIAACHNGIPVAAAESMACLTTRQCLDVLLSVKEAYRHSTLVGFSLGYDYTHILRDLPDESIYKLYRPDTRRTAKGIIKPIRWNGYLINFLRNRLTVTKLIQGKHREFCDDDSCRGCVRGLTVSVWDIFGFYQSSFIDACKNWNVIDESTHKHLKAMKDGRSTFRESEWEEIKRYCHTECQALQTLFERLKQAHKDADISLSNYFGAGSTAGALLRKMGVKNCLPSGTPTEVDNAAAFAFFGGRFECSRTGPYNDKVYSYDIASAYPYQAYLLPCLACGKWEHVKRNVHRAIEKSRFALVRYSVHTNYDKHWNISNQSWGPLPYRCDDINGIGPQDSDIDAGSIVYPSASGGGWTYRDEYLAAAANWKVKAHEAWIYQTDCAHHPFKELASLYLERLRIGKEGAGIVLKLGINSCYGKVAQSVGKPIYRCPVWAGAITSGCRAQLLRLIAQAPDDILSVATDGLVSTVPLDLPSAIDTGTYKKAREYGKVGLGEWESKEVEGGIMLIRPGVTFGLTATINNTKARGIGRSTLDRHKDIILDSWQKYGPKPVTVSSVIFRGAKSSISEILNRSNEYGQWVKRDTVLSYNPEPKRPFHIHDNGIIATWAFPQSYTSAQYDRAAIPKDVKAMIDYKSTMSEQPDFPELDDFL